jgi:hypothetical protein
LRRALIELHWSGLFPLWHWVDSLDARDCELFRLEMLVDGMLRLLGVLAAVNRVYYSRLHLKRVGALAAETRALVLAELPELELPFRFPPGSRQQPLR